MCLSVYILKVHKGVSFALTFLFLSCVFFQFLFCSQARAGKFHISKAESAYRQARRQYDRLARSPRLRKDRRSWIKVINKLRLVYLAYPDDKSVAPKALFMMAGCYRGLYGYSRSKDDLKNAIMRYEILVEKFPESRLADDALYAMAELYQRQGKLYLARDALEQILSEYPKGDRGGRAARKLKKLGFWPPRTVPRVTIASKDMKEGTTVPGAHAKSPSIPSHSATAIIGSIRYWSDKDYTRVVIDSSRAVSFKKGYLPANRRKRLPKRFFLDLSPAYKKRGLKEEIDIRDGLLKAVRVAQFQARTVRVVFDLNKTEKTRVFYLEDPFRIVVDAFGEGYSRPCPAPRRPHYPSKVTGKSGEKMGNLSLAQQLGLCVRRVVIDAGHGGKDPGAIGPSGLQEKKVVLEIAKKVAAKLKARRGWQVILTRRSDRFLPLTQRTAIANAKKADIFVSIHANAAPNRRLRGVETYFLNFALDEEAMRVAARENATSRKRISELKNILNDIMKNTKVNESSRLAAKIQENVVEDLRKRYRRIKDLGVKQAPFFVLIGARMPSVLVEVSFISNKEEERRLKNGRYLDKIADGIVKGIVSYARETEMAYLPSGTS